MELKPGAKLGPYEILSRIGEGGMGQVWKARDTRLDRIVALKTSAAAFSQRFEGEARAVAALNHPHICSLYDVGPDYLVMEYVEGTELKGPLPLSQALTYAIQLASALEAAHRKTITHRDLKPANILVARSGVKVLDFGLAKTGKPDERPQPEDDETPTRVLTQEGSIVGTLQYMAPEQLRGEAIDTRADIFSFGCVLYEVLTGKPAFPATNAASLIAAILERPAPSVAEVAPASLDWLLGRCLAKDREDRWQTARDLRAELEHIARGGGEAAAPVVAPPSQVGKLPWLAAAAGLAIAAIVGILWLRQPRPAPPQLISLDLQLPEDLQFRHSIAISPDGRTIAFTASGGADGRDRLWVRPLDGTNARPLPGTEGTNENNVLLWSPDSRTLVFQSSAAAKLRKTDINGGPVQSVCDYNAALVGGFITADNRIIFGTPARDGIQECPASGGAARSITTLQRGGTETWHGFPSLLPDRRHFLFGRYAGAESAIYVGSLDGRPEEQLRRRLLPNSIAALYVAESAAGNQGHILFSLDGTLMAQGFDAERLHLTGEAVPLAENLASWFSFSASSDGKLAYLTAAGRAQLTWVDRQGQAQGTLGSEGRPLAGMRISPDGARLAVSRKDRDTGEGIWIMNLAQGVETRLTTANSSPVWSPDGKQIAFASRRDGVSNLYFRASDGGGNDELLLRTAESKSPLDWSRDGRFLLFSMFDAKAGYDIWVLPMDTGTTSGSAGNAAKPLPFLRTVADENEARFSPDGRFVAYTSNESGSVEVFVRPFDPANPTASGSGAGKVQVSVGGGLSPMWRADGRELLYAQGNQVWSVEVATTPAFHAGVPKRLFERQAARTRAMTSDGQRFLFDVPIGKTTAKVVLNWQAALKKK